VTQKVFRMNVENQCVNEKRGNINVVYMASGENFVANVITE
jgi:hypothetical protein